MELLTMSRPEIARLDACQRLEAGTLTQAEVAAQLGLCDRQVRRLLARYRSGGPAGLRSVRRGQPSNRRIAEAVLREALDLVRERYLDFGPTFANEKLRELHGICIGTETLRKAMIRADLWQARRKPYRRTHRPRERRPCFGELVQIDGSPHDWFEGRAARCSLIVFIDDATSKLVGLRFVPVESTWAYFDLLRSYIGSYGRPLALYSDRHSIFRSTHSEYTETKETQLGQALRELDIELLCATTPQAKGRVERVNRTLQQRLLRELRLRSICTIDDANGYLPEFIEDHNQRFAVAPRCQDDLHRPLDGIDLLRALCCRYERSVTAERTFQIGQNIYALDDQSIRPKTRLSIREQQDQSFEIIAGSRILAYHKLRTLTQGAIVDSKVIRQPVDPRAPNPKKGHKPKLGHPWKTPF
ncbi:MAG TPA: ISNCY family transposase [Candidatus Dormibacteraeota bacterium]|nr:ISNCY family transposase [Candidatus Dormibacteraeota bacterium]